MQDDIIKKISEYSTLSQDKLLDEMMQIASEGKKDGTLDNKMLDTFYSQASQFLNANQLEKLQSLIDMIKFS